MSAFSLLAVAALVGCGQVSPVTSDEPVGDGVADVPSVTTQPVVDRDYGIYRDAILQGGEMYAGSVEFANHMALCVADRGFYVTADETGRGQFVAHHGVEQTGEFIRAYDECMQGAIDDGVIAYGVPDEETLRLWYRAYVEVAYECLNEQGYPTTPPPSEDVWVQDYPFVQFEPWRVWHPHDLVWHLAESLEGACSQEIVDLLVELGRRDSEAAP